MFRTAFLFAIALAIAFGLGVPSVRWALDNFGGMARVSVGEWTAEPYTATADADPYSRAVASREASLPLGHAEGIEFVAGRDHERKVIVRECDYDIAGPMPPARFYTIHARDSRGNVIATGNLRFPALHSAQLLRDPAGAAAVRVGPSPVAGNWLPTTGRGPMTIVLTLYDTPIVANSSIQSVALPVIRRTNCNG